MTAPSRKLQAEEWMPGIAGLVLIASLLSLAAAGAPEPNVLLIMADDMGYECVRANGGTDYQTPHLDALAASGMRFTRCHSQPLCTPSRAQLMSGQYNSRNYIRFGQLHPEHPSFGRFFKSQGYDTVVVGKWQLDGGPHAPAQYGFDRWCLWQVTARPERHWGPGLEIDGQTKTFEEERFGPDIAVEYLETFLKEHAKPDARPFLAYYPMILPHSPFVSTPKNVAQTGRKKKSDPDLFPDFIHYTDALVGRLLETLERLGLRENTLVMFVGDNGTSVKITSTLHGRPYPGGKGRLTRHGTHVPLLVSWPARVRAGATSDALIDFSDFFPTMVHAVTGEAEFALSHEMDGRSFLPVLRGEKAATRSWSYCYYVRSGNPDDARQFVHNHQFKLYDTGEYYDLTRDVFEKHPISEPSGPTHAMLQEALRREMARAREHAPQLRAWRQSMAPPTYQKRSNFDD